MCLCSSELGEETQNSEICLGLKKWLAFIVSQPVPQVAECPQQALTECKNWSVMRMIASIL